MDRLKQWLKAACDAFLSGIRGEAPPSVGGVPAGKGPIVMRDGLLAFVELLLTAAAIFTYIRVPSILVKVLLIPAIIISGMRTYTAGMKLREGLFGWLDRK